jgi:hypothetical protein
MAEIIPIIIKRAASSADDPKFTEELPLWAAVKPSDTAAHYLKPKRYRCPLVMVRAP